MLTRLSVSVSASASVCVSESVPESVSSYVSGVGTLFYAVALTRSLPTTNFSVSCFSCIRPEYQRMPPRAREIELTHIPHKLYWCVWPQVYAIMATDLFREHSDYFQDFGASLFTLFQIATGDSWASDVARGLMTTYRQDVDAQVSVQVCSCVFLHGRLSLSLSHTHTHSLSLSLSRARARMCLRVHVR